MNKTLRNILILVVIAAVIGCIAFVVVRTSSGLGSLYETEALARGDLTAKIDAVGYVRPYQSAYMVWKSSGEVEDVLVEVGDTVEAGQVLARLDESTLPSYLILSQANLISAQQSLENLLETQTQQALALKAIDDAEQALTDAQNPELNQAEALAEVAAAQDAIDDAELNYALVAKPASQDAIDQAYANMIVAENNLAEIQDSVDQMNRKINRPLPWYADFIKLDKSTYRKALRGMEYQLSQSQLNYNEKVEKYNSLITPPDPLDVAQAEAQLATAQAQLAEAERQYQQAMQGPSEGEIAVLEAQLADAQREYERVKDGPPAEDIAILEAQIAAAEAGLAQKELTAPFGGTVVEMNTQVNDWVNPGTVALRIDNRSHFYVDLQISETDIHEIEVGQVVEIELESMPGQIYQGEVTEIGIVGVQVLNDIRFDVVVEVQDPDQEVKPGMTAAVDITIAELSDVLLIPNRAVRIVDGERVVYTLQGGVMPISIPFQMGYSSNRYSEVLESELTEGDPIVLNPPSMLFMQMDGPPSFVQGR